MKSSNMVVTVVVVGAVLVAAYAVGLLIRQARTGDSSSSPGSATDVNETRIREETAQLAHEPGTGGMKDSQKAREARAKFKEKRAQDLKEMESATEEEKAKIREQVRESVSARSGTKTVRRPSSRPTGAAVVPAVRDPNASQSGKKPDSEPNRAGES